MIKYNKYGDIFDLVNSTYIIKIERKYDEDNEFYTEFLEFDPKLNEDGKYVFEQDMNECDIFKNIPIGKYKLKVLWYYYQCGNYEFPDEWDVKIKILSQEEIK